MNRKSLPVIALALALPMLAATIQATSAGAAQPHAKGSPAHVSHARPSSKLPGAHPDSLSGYQQVESALLTDAAATQVGGSVACPAGTKVVGGGAVISGTSLAENLNASVPFTNGKGWLVYVNNAGSTDGSFEVYADCVKNVSTYSVVIGAGLDNPSGTQVTATASCPSGTVPLGGGGFASSGSTGANLNTSIPTSTGWRTDVNNADASLDNTASAYAVCGKQPKGYSQVVGTAVTVNAFTQINADAACPSGKVVFGGGDYSSSASTSVDLNSSASIGTAEWRVWENNNTDGATSLTSYAICGKVS